jgi:hypothetical protein
MKFTYEETSKGRCFYNFQNEGEPEYEFEFEIEYKPGIWYPLNNGQLLGNGRFEIPENMSSWNKIPGETRIGFRGPMIRLRDLDKLPKVFL